VKQSQPSDSALRPLRVPAEALAQYMPSECLPLPPHAAVHEVLLQRFTHRSVTEPVLVPAVAEPLLVLVLAGSAVVEERSLGGEWASARVDAGDFYLTSTQQPYEMRWQAGEGGSFEVMHLYLSPTLIEQAARELPDMPAGELRFRDVSAQRDGLLGALLEPLRAELCASHTPSPLFVHGLAQALAVHLVRCYRDPGVHGRRSNALQAYKLRRVLEAMEQGLAQPFSLAELARTAQLSEYHFSRLFKRATGLSPSRYFIRLRIARARQRLLESERSIIDIGLDVGYSSAAHFSQVFRREVGVTPSVYRNTAVS